MGSLKTTEKYALAQILVCGKISRGEFTSANNFLGQVQAETISRLKRKGFLQYTLFQHDG